MMPILRHERKRDFTIIPNQVFRERRLSLKGVGLLCTLLSFPDDWQFSVAGLGKICSHDRRDGISTAVKELEGAGYLIRKRSRRPNGTVGDALWIVSDVPMTENPAQEKPMLASPTQENPEQLNTYPTKNKSNKELNMGCASPTCSRFEPPTVEEVRAYCQERGNDIDPQRFVDYYAATGWKRNGNVPVKDWQACVRNWERREKMSSQKAITPDYTAYQEDSL